MSESDGSQEYPVELDSELENILCQLWDMTVDQDVGKYLYDLGILNLLLDAVTTTSAPRLMEIGVGILANLSCHVEILRLMEHNERLQKTCVDLLHCTDPPTLSELMRLFEIFCSKADTYRGWITLWDDPELWVTTSFILSSSTRTQLLKNVGKCVDCVLDADDGLRCKYANHQLLGAVLDAINELGFKDLKALDSYMHILQVFGDEVLRLSSEAVLKCCKSYLEGVFIEDKNTMCIIPVASVWKVYTSLMSGNDTILSNFINGNITDQFVKSCCLCRPNNSRKIIDKLSQEEIENRQTDIRILDTALISAFELLTLTDQMFQKFIAGLSNCEEDEIRGLCQFARDNEQSAKFLDLKRSESTEIEPDVLSMIVNFLETG